VLDARPAVERRIGHDGRITVDRATLRQQLLQLAVEDAPVKVLLVRGGPNTGKSWSRHLFERASKDRGADMTYLFNGTIGSVEELVRKLFSRLRASERVPEQDTTDPGYYQHVCDRLAEEAARYGRPLWIAVDDLGPGPDGMTPIMDPKIREFFEQFALNLLDPAVHRWFRLLLIHYPDGKVPAQWERELWEEDRPDPGDVRPEDVAAVLREWAASHDKQLLDDEVERLAKEVMARAAAPPPPGQPDGDTPWLRRLNDELKRTLENLGGQST
jgi:hypothetical protein